jgi:hypothetical protein
MTSLKNTLRSESSVSGADETARSDGTLRPTESDSSSESDVDALQNQIESLQIVDTLEAHEKWIKSLPESVKQLGLWIQESQNILVLTGAGISVSAGIPDFRTPGSGLVSLHHLYLYSIISAGS